KFVLLVRVRSFENQGPLIDEALFPEMKYIQGHRLGNILNVEARATQGGLEKTGVSVLGLELEDLSPSYIDYIFMFWQLVSGGVEQVLNIDAFSQLGVELAKRLARENLVHR